MADPFARAGMRFDRVPVDPRRPTPRDDTRETLRRMVEALDAMSPDEIAAILADDSVDEAP